MELLLILLVVIVLVLLLTGLANRTSSRGSVYDPVEYSPGAVVGDCLTYYVNSNDGEPGQGNDTPPVKSYRWWEPAMDDRAEEMAAQWDRLQEARADGRSVQAAGAIAQVSRAEARREAYGREMGDVELGDVYRKDARSGNWFKDND